MACMGSLGQWILSRKATASHSQTSTTPASPPHAGYPPPGKGTVLSSVACTPSGHSS